MLQQVTQSAELVKFLAIANDPERIIRSTASFVSRTITRRLCGLTVILPRGDFRLSSSFVIRSI